MNLTTHKNTELGEHESGTKMKVWGENTGAYRPFLTYILIQKIIEQLCAIVLAVTEL